MNKLEELDLYVKTIDMYMKFKSKFHDQLESRIDTDITKVVRTQLKKIQALIDLQRKQLNY